MQNNITPTVYVTEYQGCVHYNVEAAPGLVQRVELKMSFREGCGIAAYNEDLRRQPGYQDGTARKTWFQLGEVEKESWMRNPTPREHKVTA